MVICRGGGIRTRDDEHPKLVHYQAVRLPEKARFLAQGGDAEGGMGRAGFDRNCTEFTEWTEYSDDHEAGPEGLRSSPATTSTQSSCTTRLCDSPRRRGS